MLQKKAICIECHTPYNAPATNLHKVMNILQFEYLCKFQVCQFMFKMKNQILACPLLNVIRRNNEKYQYDTHYKDDFIIPNFKNDIVVCSFLSTGPRMWSNIPNNVKSTSVSQKTFCRKMKQHYIEYIVFFFNRMVKHNGNPKTAHRM